MSTHVASTASSIDYQSKTSVVISSNRKKNSKISRSPSFLALHEPSKKKVRLSKIELVIKCLLARIKKPKQAASMM